MGGWISSPIPEALLPASHSGAASEWRQANPISSRLLGRVETGVRRSNQFVPGCSVVRESSSSSTDCDLPRHARELPALHHLSQFFGDADSVGSAGLGQQNAEFLASIPANHINFPQLLME